MCLISSIRARLFSSSKVRYGGSLGAALSWSESVPRGDQADSGRAQT